MYSSFSIHLYLIAGQGAEQANETAVRERSELEVDVDLTSTWLALQALSVAVDRAHSFPTSAWEIATEMQLAGGGGERRRAEAPSFDEELGPRHGVTA